MHHNHAEELTLASVVNIKTMLSLPPGFNKYIHTHPLRHSLYLIGMVTVCDGRDIV